MTDTHLSEEERKRLRDLETKVAQLSERTHQQANQQQREMLLNRTAPAAPAPDPIPAWVKIGGAVGALAVSLIVVGTFAATVIRQDAAVLNRLQGLEAWKTEMVAASLTTRLQTLETGVDTARRIRDQQQQGTADRLRSLEQADQAGSERLNTVLQQLATITAQLQAQAVRTEEVLRRQDRLENRLGRTNGPAPTEEPTALRLMHPLVWRLPH